MDIKNWSQNYAQGLFSLYWINFEYHFEIKRCSYLSINGDAISSHNSLGMWLLLHAGI